MSRAFRLYFLLLALTYVLVAANLWAALGGGTSWNLDLVRFLLGATLLGAAAATWGAAIFIAYVHRVTWPIVVLAGMVVIASGGFAVWCHQTAAASSLS